MWLSVSLWSPPSALPLLSSLPWSSLPWSSLPLSSLPCHQCCRHYHCCRIVITIVIVAGAVIVIEFKKTVMILYASEWIVTSWSSLEKVSRQLKVTDAAWLLLAHVNDTPSTKFQWFCFPVDAKNWQHSIGRVYTMQSLRATSQLAYGSFCSFPTSCYSACILQEDCFENSTADIECAPVRPLPLQDCIFGLYAS